MDLFNSVYHNFFSVCSLIPVSFMLSLAIIFLIIPNKSKATFHMGMSYLYLVFFFAGYFIAAIFYHPLAAYHRWLTVGFVNLAITHYIIFPFNFPDEKYTKAGRIVGLVYYIIAMAMTGAFIFLSLKGGTVYHFSGHYWDFDIDEFSKIFGYVIIFFMFSFLITGIWRTIVTKSKERWAVLAISIVMFSAVITPGITNALSRDGMIDRGFYQITQDLFTIVGFFIVTIIYINTTRDRTNFMIKILAISFATFLIVFQGLSYFSLQDLENAYDSLRMKDLRITLSTNQPGEDMAYMLSYSVKDKKFSTIAGDEQTFNKINFRPVQTELYNTLYYEKINAARGDNTRDDLKQLLLGTEKYFSGYRKSILHHIETAAEIKNADLPADILQYINSLERNILYTSNKIKKLPDINFRDSINVFLKKEKPAMKYFKEAILNHVAESGSEDGELKKEILPYLSPMKKSGARHYRKSTDGRHYASFIAVNILNDTAYEAGFSYLEYRKYLHPTSMKFIIMLAGILIVIFIGFQFFFRGAFIQPIKTLLRGMHSVREGDLTVQIPVLVADELGHISKNFNHMVDTLRETRKELDDYAENLELKVEQRTKELKEALDELEIKNREIMQARDALWGEMELAKKIQTALIPTKPAITGYEISAHMAPADEVGGDYYDIINLKGLDWIIIGDVSGHGVPAGLIMMMVQTAIHTVLTGTSNLKPEALLARVNTVITENVRRLKEDKYMTITVLACLTKGRFHFSGLHQDIMIYRAETDSTELVETDGMWIGIVDDIKEMISDSQLHLDIGDCMLLYTDGITEAWKKDGADSPVEKLTELYGDDRLQRIFHQHRNKPTSEIKNAILKSLDGYICKDDVTMVVIRRTG